MKLRKIISIIEKNIYEGAMKQSFLFIFAFLQIFSSIIFSQSKVDTDIEAALVNARKGVFWALMNIPVKKAKVEKSLINEDSLLPK